MGRIYFTFLTIIIGWQVQAQNLMDSVLKSELERMIVLDQIVATNAEPPAGLTQLSKKELKDSIYRAHTESLKIVLEENGFPGYDLIGKRGAGLFFIMVQHADHDIEFQKKALSALREEVLIKNANPRHLGLLTDRIRINSGQKQLYGSQVAYHFLTGKAKYLPVEDEKNLDKRRAEIGLEPIEEYLREMTSINKGM